MKFPSKVCEKNLSCDQAIQCDLCDSWVYIKCNDLKCTDFKLLQNSNDLWFCILCCSEILLFSTVKNESCISCWYDSNNKSKYIDGKDSPLLLKPSTHLKHLVNQFNNMSSPHNDINSDEPGNTVSSKYYDAEERQGL